MRDLLFWGLIYLYHGVICLCRCLCGNRCICKVLIFAVADAFFETDVSRAGLIFIVADALFGINISATCFSSNLQILLSLPVMYNCIYIVPFLKLADASFANFASTSHVIDNVKMLLIEITHLQLALSITCGYTPQKFCIYIPRFR